MSPSDFSSFSPLVSQQLHSAAKVLRQGGVVAFPTESSYGFAVDIDNEKALRRLYQLKNRPANKAFPVLVNGKDELRRLVTHIPKQYETLIKEFWPGALTLVFPVAPQVNSILIAGGDTIAIRYSSNVIANGLVTAFGSAITATSANRTDEMPCTTAQEVVEKFGSGIDKVIDGGEAAAAPSTIVELRHGKLQVLREGELAPLLSFRKTEQRGT